MFKQSMMMQSTTTPACGGAAMRPSLIKTNKSMQAIFGDKQILAALERYMRQCYCEEGILFLNAARALNAKLSKKLSASKQRKADTMMLALFSDFVSTSAEQQINVSSGCLANLQTVFSGDWKALSLDVKRTIFAQCIQETERLINTSVLSGFYATAEYQRLTHTKSVSRTFASLFRWAVPAKEEQMEQETEVETESEYESDSELSVDYDSSEEYEQATPSMSVSPRSITSTTCSTLRSTPRKLFF